MLSEREKLVVDWYNQNAEDWAKQRKKTSEPSFWAQEYTYFEQLGNPPRKLLEIGSGSGREALEWSRMGYEYSGIDTSTTLIQIARKTEPLGRYFLSSVYEMPFSSNTFDAFSSWAMLPHIPKERIGVALDAIQRVLKPQGLGFIAMREGVEERQEPETGRWFSYYSQNELEDTLTRHGFEILSKGTKPSRVDLTWLTFFVRSQK
ncbi:MAG: class I SAM-dependent methyltransferase [Simkania sp.]|nr:class I SAM-dependent methyltransferase [Simkania sp.]